MIVFENVIPDVYAFVKRNPVLIKPAKFILASLHRIRVVLFNAFNRSDQPAAPHRSCDDTGRWVRDFCRGEKVPTASILYVHQKTNSLRKVPGHLGDTLFWKFAQNLEFPLPPTFVAQIPDARVLDEGFVISPDNQLLSDVSVIIDQKSSEHSAFHDGGIGPVQRIRGKVAVLATYAGRGYYHWMIDVLPRLELIRLANYDLEEIDKFIVNCCITSYQIETLKTLGIPHEKLILIQSTKHVSVEQLILPSLTNVYQSVPKWTCDFINKTFVDSGHHNKSSGRRIYISRGIASRRHVSNEAALVNLLKSLGFEIVTLEQMKVSDQAQLFQSAAVVVGPHGAGLTNWVFCEPHTKVLEIMHPQAINLMFWTIASHRDLDYYYLFSKGNLAEVGREAFLNSDDMEVDLEAMKLMLNKMGVS